MKAQPLNHSIILSFFLCNLLFASRFWAMIASGNTEFSSIENFSPMMDQISNLASQGYNHHQSGFGLIYYVNGEYGEQATWVDGDPQGPKWRYSYSPHSNSPEINQIKWEMRMGGQQTINDPSDGATCSIAHVRKASSGCGSDPGESNPPNPHPFIATLSDGTTYSFAHNGTLNDNDKELLRDELITIEWMDNNFQPSTYPEAGCGGDWHTEEGFAHVIDSELYFFWILKNIMAEETGNVLRGIHKALSHPQFRYLDRHKNFVLTNGTEIWSYRSTDSQDEYDNSSYPNYWHTVYWKYVNDPQFGNYKSVMSQNSGYGWEFLNEGALVYLPRKGKPFVIESFAYLPDVEQKLLNENWNWVGFPILPDNDETPVTEAFSRLTDLNDPFSYVNTIDVRDLDVGTIWENENWQLPGYPITSVNGYKINIADDDYTLFNTPFSGTKIAPDTPIELTEGENWICYFLPELNHPSDAFPQYVLDRMVSIMAQDWFLTRRNGSFYTDKECPPYEEGTISECHQLVYGNMYIVNMAEPATFSWIFPHEEPSEYNDPTPIHFSYEEQGAYLPVVIESIENEQNIIEIGAFNENDICVGAEVVSGTPVNFKLYNQSLENVSFEAVTESSAGRIAGNSNYEKNFKAGEIKSENAIQYIILKSFDKKPDLTKKGKPSIIQVYPNPFNSGTEIKITLDHFTKVALEIYSVTGQHITDINRSTLKKGTHTFHWSGKNKDQKNVPNGIYFYRFSTPKKIIKGKLLYLK